MSDPKRDEILEKIAKGCLGVSLELTRSDMRKTVSLVDLKQALQVAYKYGQESRDDSGKT